MNQKASNKLDISLIAFCNGDAQAMAGIYKKWSAELFFIAYKYLRSKEDSEDIVADAFEKLLKMPIDKRKQKFLETQIDIKALLIVVVKNKSLDKIKVRNNRRKIIDKIQHLLPRTSKNGAWDKFSNEMVESLLVLLPERDCQVFKMMLQGYSREEIATTYNVSLKTVSNILSTSRNTLKELIDDFY